MRLKSSFLSVTLALTVFGLPMFLPTSVALAVSASDILIDAAPSNPAPYQSTTITLSTYAANLDSVLISWYVNGKNSLSGIGKKSFSFTTGASGVETKIEAKIGMPDGELTKRISLRPSVMVLLWQATDSYVPPFYKGKALLSEGSEVKIVAMPEIKIGNSLINSKNMTYSWKKDYTNDSDGSGYGKNYYIYTSDYLESASNVSVIASTLDQEHSAEANITTSTTAPQLSFYKRDETSGIDWDRALTDGHTISGNEIIVAAPYYISPKEVMDPSLVFRWYINDKMIDVQNFYKNLMPLTVEGASSGTSKLRLDIENTDKIFQTASKGITIQF